MSKNQRLKRWDDDTFNWGFSLYTPCTTLEHSWQAAYGMELIRISREADKAGEMAGHFVEAYYPTEDEFREARMAIKRGRRKKTAQTLIPVLAPQLMKGRGDK